MLYHLLNPVARQEFYETVLPPHMRHRRITIAQDFAIVRNDSGNLTWIGSNNKFEQIDSDRLFIDKHRFSNERILKVVATPIGCIALTRTGKIAVCEPMNKFAQTREDQYIVESSLSERNSTYNWVRVIDISAMEGGIATLFNDGTVNYVEYIDGNFDKPFRIGNLWNEGIIQMACGCGFIVGLTNLGRLISFNIINKDKNYVCSNWPNVRQFDLFSNYAGRHYTIAQLERGVIVSDFTDEVKTWKNVESISVGDGIAVGLKSDGTAYFADSSDERMESYRKIVESWRNIDAIECKYRHIVALLKDGQIVSTF